MSFKKGIRILRHQGMATFIKRFFVFLSKNIFMFRTYNFYKKSLHESKKFDRVLKVGDSTLVIIHVPSEVDKLIEDGFTFGSYQDIYDIKKLLNQDAILFCIFFEKNWAHTSWASIKNGASVDPFFENLQYQNGGYIGTCSTNPNYRGLGLYPYVLLKICEFFKSRGISTALISTAKNNASSIAGISKAGFLFFSEGYNLNIGGWKSWVVKQQ